MYVLITHIAFVLFNLLVNLCLKTLSLVQVILLVWNGVLLLAEVLLLMEKQLLVLLLLLLHDGSSFLLLLHCQHVDVLSGGSEVAVRALDELSVRGRLLELANCSLECIGGLLLGLLCYRRILS